MSKAKLDIPLDQAVKLVRACQKLNCDTAEQLFAMVERRCTDEKRLRDALIAMRNAVKDHPDFQRRDKFLNLGIQVNDAIQGRS